MQIFLRQVWPCQPTCSLSLSPRAGANSSSGFQFPLQKGLVNGEVRNDLKGPGGQLGLTVALVLSLVGQVVSPPQVPHLPMQLASTCLTGEGCRALPQAHLCIRVWGTQSLPLPRAWPGLRKEHKLQRNSFRGFREGMGCMPATSFLPVEPGGGGHF